MSEDAKTETPVKKKSKMLKLLLAGVGVAALVGGGAGAGLYFANGGLAGGGKAAKPDQPQLVLKGEQKAAEAEEGGDHGAAPAKGEGGEGGSKYASTYYQLEKEFTSNLRNSAHFIQIGLAVSTNYDGRVIKNVEANELAVRSAVLMTLSDTDEAQVFTPEGKRQLQGRLVASINQVLKEKEGFGGIGNVYFTNFIVQ
ncbi:flagellar basal body-associated FliL family protein [Sphingomonas flavalba]|uniref:flagellar basal body-associated FliL family protein n=1 Tax=Sphingomonas flavalba TaxID=2559804 RepID=UPI001EF0E89A|nr:flagellar basal body-associated FliL family protein [Sphingomonas flavalba]